MLVSSDRRIMGTYVNGRLAGYLVGHGGVDVDRCGVVARDLMSSNRRHRDRRSAQPALSAPLYSEATTERGAMGLRIALATTVEASPSEVYDVLRSTQVKRVLDVGL